jgi:hypothetical protein
VSDRTLDIPPIAHREPAPASGRERSFLARTWEWWAVAAVLVIISIVLVAWARTAPSYDAFGWLVWGFQTLHGTLDLGGAPSWKPLPYVFTVPYALFSMPVEKWLWMVTAVAVSLSGSVFAGRIAFRLTVGGTFGAGGAGTRATGASRERLAAAWVAAVFAGAILLGTEDYMHYILSVQSDPMIVTFVLAAVDAHLCGRPRLAIALGTLASLGRPEAWPWLGLYGLWCWFRVPRTRALLVFAAIVVLMLWFGVPYITNHRPFVSAQLAFNSPRELRQNQIGGTLGRFHELLFWPAWLAAGIGVVWAAVRRDRIALGIAGIVVGWVIVEIAFALHGWPALPRYMFEAGGLVAVLAGAAVGWTLIELPRLRAGIPRWAGIPLAVLLAIALIPGAVTRLRTERHDLRHERGRATDISLLAGAVSALGGWQHVRHCAKPTANVEWVSALAFATHADVGVLGHLPNIEIRLVGHPVLLFTPLARGGWRIVPYHLHHHDYAACRGLRAYYVRTPGHPGGQLVRY